MVRIQRRRSFGIVPIVLVSLFSVNSLGHAQQTAVITGVSVHSNVSASGSLFNFSYSLTNDTTNIGPISKVDLDISLPNGASVLNGDGVQNGEGFMEDITSSVLLDPETPPTVPVGLSAPGGWLTAISIKGTAGWIAQSDNAAITPGNSLTGYQLTSPGLPGIRTLLVEADYDINSLGIAPPTDGGPDLIRYDDDLAAALKNFRTTTATVGPTAPPANFQPIQFLQTIQNYKEQAFKQGWIANAGVANSLDVKLNAALAALQTSDIGTAKNILKALLNEVAAQDAKQLSPEAVALLQFNTQYLLTRLP